MTDGPTSVRSSPPLRRGPALLFCMVIIAATAWPVTWELSRDDFPLSPFPMFSEARQKPWLDVVVGFDADGGEHKIPPELVANMEVMQAAQTIRLAVRHHRAKKLCKQIAARVAASEELRDVVVLEVQRRQFEPRRYFVDADGQRPLDIRHKARCRVERELDEADA